MNPRQITWMLSAATAAFSLGALASILLAMFLPVATDVLTVAPSASAHGATATTGPTSLPAATGDERIWALALRQQLTDAAPAPATATAATPTGAPPPVTLVGTIGNSLAMFKSGNEIVNCVIGDIYNGVEILAIRPSQVDVKFSGRLVTLEKPPESGGNR